MKFVHPYIVIFVYSYDSIYSLLGGYRALLVFV